MQSETSLQGSLSVERMCQLGQVNRAGFYRYFQTRARSVGRQCLNFTVSTMGFTPQVRKSME